MVTDDTRDGEADERCDDQGRRDGGTRRWNSCWMTMRGADLMIVFRINF